MEAKLSLADIWEARGRKQEARLTVLSGYFNGIQTELLLLLCRLPKSEVLSLEKDYETVKESWQKKEIDIPILAKNTSLNEKEIEFVLDYLDGLALQTIARHHNNSVRNNLTPEGKELSDMINNHFSHISEARLMAFQAFFRGQTVGIDYLSRDIIIDLEEEYNLVKKAWEKGTSNIYKSLQLTSLCEREVKYILDYLNTGELNDDLDKEIDNFNKVTFRILEMQFSN